MSTAGRPTLTSALVLPVLFGLGRVNGAWFRHVRELEFSDLDQREKWQLSRLRRLVEYAGTSSPHYREMFGAAGLSASDLTTLEDLSRFPILEKDHLAETNAHPVMTRSTRWKRTMRSAGTSGQPVAVQIDLHAWIRMLARRRYLFAQHGIAYGDREARCWGRRHAGGVSLMDRLLSRRVFTFEAADGHGPDAELQAMRAFEPQYIYGYPSVVQEMVRHLAASDVRVPGVAATVLTAERVPPSLIAEVSEEIGCPTVREYGCSEMDIIAFDCPAGRYHVASDHVIVESVATEDGAGEAIVTDLDNMLTPLIRYRLGDRIKFSGETCPCGRTSPVIASIEGRTGDRRYLMCPDGRRRHSVLFAYLFERLRERGLPIHQFLVEQLALDMIRVNLDMGGEELAPEVSNVVEREIVAEVGTDFSIEVVQVSLRRQSGAKWNYFVSLDRAEPDRS